MIEKPMSKIFTAPSILTSIAYTRDKGLRITFVTQEIDDETRISAASYHGQFGQLAFKQSDIQADEIPDADVSDESKTPSQRLRAVLFVFWTQQGSKGNFNEYYRKWIEVEIVKVKNKLTD